VRTECQEDSYRFQGLGRRDVVARFDGGAITSDGGGLLLREVEARSGIIARFARGFADHRDPELIQHTLEELIRQRVYGLCLGYEDLNDHDDLRHDPLLAVLVGKTDPTGENRHGRDQGKPLAGKSTLNRLELTPAGADLLSRSLLTSTQLRPLRSYSIWIRQMIPFMGINSGVFFKGIIASIAFCPCTFSVVSIRSAQSCVQPILMPARGH
jgi:hypothetical protein